MALNLAPQATGKLHTGSQIFPKRLTTCSHLALVPPTCRRGTFKRIAVSAARNVSAFASKDASSTPKSVEADAADQETSSSKGSGRSDRLTPRDTVDQDDQSSRVKAAKADKQSQSSTKSNAYSAAPESSPAELFRQQRDAANQKPNFVQRVWGEVGLIEWPSPSSALLSTGLVILIVVGSSVVLFFVNLVLSEGFQSVYN